MLNRDYWFKAVWPSGIVEISFHIEGSMHVAIDQGRRLVERLTCKGLQAEKADCTVYEYAHVLGKAPDPNQAISAIHGFTCYVNPEEPKCKGSNSGAHAWEHLIMIEDTAEDICENCKMRRLHFHWDHEEEVSCSRINYVL